MADSGGCVHITVRCIFRIVLYDVVYVYLHTIARALGNNTIVGLIAVSVRVKHELRPQAVPGSIRMTRFETPPTTCP